MSRTAAATASTASATRRTAPRWAASSASTRSPTTDQSYPSVAALAGGGFVVTWTSSGQDGSGYDIYGQRYAADGTAVGSEFRVNTFTTNDQDLSLRDGARRRRLRGDVVVVWPGRRAATASTASATRRTAPRWAASSASTRSPPTTKPFLRDGARRRRLRGDVVVAWPGRQRLRHLRPALRGGRHRRWAASSASTRSPPAIRSRSFYGSETVATLADGRLVQVWSGSGGPRRCSSA